MALYMGLDVGGTFVKGIIIDENGKLICEDSIPTVTGEGLADCIEALAETLVRHSGLMFSAIEGAGVGCPGLIDSAEGKVIFAGNMRLRDYPLQKLLQDKLGVTVKICNDANAAALGEARFGAGKGYKDSVLITLGTGVGGGIVIDGKLFEGYKSAGAEIGHTVIVHLRQTRLLRGVLLGARAYCKNQMGYGGGHLLRNVEHLHKRYCGRKNRLRIYGYRPHRKEGCGLVS